MSPMLTTSAPGTGSAGIQDPSFASTIIIRTLSMARLQVPLDITHLAMLPESHLLGGK